MSDPVLLVVDHDEDALHSVEREMHDRYGRQYRVECFASAQQARQRLSDLAQTGDDVALIVAAHELDDATPGIDLLREAGRLHPHTRRALLIAWGEHGEPVTGDAIFEAIARGHIEHYLRRPSPPDEFFHHEISGLLAEWWDTQRDSPYTIFVIGESWSGRAYELRETLGRCAMPHTFHLADSEAGKLLVDQAGAAGPLPLVVFPDGTVLQNPTNADMIEAMGSPVRPGQTDFDLVIVGAGPAGLSGAVYGASEGFNTLVVDEGGLGGQATSSSLIRNYLGFPRGVSGRNLAQNAYAQAWVFGARFAFMQRVTDLKRVDGDLVVSLSESGPVTGKAVLLTAGVTYRRLGIPELEALNGAGVFYGASTSEAPTMSGRTAFVVGGANSAGQTALYLSRYARRVTLVVRADRLEATMSYYLVRQVEAAPNIDVRLRSEVVGGGGGSHLERLVLRDRDDGTDETVDADALFLMIGAEPRTEWLPPEILRDAQGFVLTGRDLLETGAWPLHREPLLLETSMPGVFAAGDIRHGSVKRVASAVGEGSVAIQLLHQYFSDDPLNERDESRLPAGIAAPDAP
jgi:thioredoxin reductase (NADPH)